MNRIHPRALLFLCLIVTVAPSGCKPRGSPVSGVKAGGAFYVPWGPEYPGWKSGIEGGGESKSEEMVPCYPSADICPSIVQVLAFPGYFHGKQIEVDGYLVVKFEEDSIYFSETDAKYGMTRNGFWVKFKDNSLGLTREEIKRRFSGKYVCLEGTFDKECGGHEGCWSGAFFKISGITSLGGPSDQRKEAGAKERPKQPSGKHGPAGSHNPSD